MDLQFVMILTHITNILAVMLNSTHAGFFAGNTSYVGELRSFTILAFLVRQNWSITPKSNDKGLKDAQINRFGSLENIKYRCEKGKCLHCE